jgi:predicted ATPase
MFLQSAHIRHYKSLDDVLIEFADPITVIVGPNAAGKSNIVDSLRFVRDAVTSGLEHAVSKRGGIERVRQNSKAEAFEISFQMKFLENREDIGDQEDRASTFSFAIKSRESGNYAVDREMVVGATLPDFLEGLRINTEADDGFSNANYLRAANGRVQSNIDAFDYPVPADQLVLGSHLSHGWMGFSIANFARQWRYFALFPNTLKVLSPADKDTALTEEGGNWASVIRALEKSSEGRAALERINDAMRSVIPSFQDVTVTALGGYLVPKFRFGADGEFDPQQLSDGTLRIYGLLLALYQLPAPALLVIEEPEQTVHPGVLSVLADAMREASENTQIIVTTHSPHLVDQFEPEQIRVATLENGVTHVAPIKAAQIKAVKRRLMSLEEFMLAEGLQPERP